MSEKKPINIQALQHQASQRHVSDEFIKENQSMVEAIAAKVVSRGKLPPGIEFSDLVNWGIEGLIKAKGQYDESKGSKFKTYSYYRIQGEMLDRIRIEWNYHNPGSSKKRRKQIRDKIADLVEIQLKEDSDKSVDSQVQRLIENSGVAYMLSIDNHEVISETAGTKDPEIEIIDQNTGLLWEEVGKLPEKDQELIELFYIKGKKQIEIAEILKCSPSKVCRMHMDMLDRLKKRLNRRENE